MKFRFGIKQKENKDKTLYSFYSAKKLYFQITPKEYLLLEKTNIIQEKSISLLSRGATLIQESEINKDNYHN